MLCQALRPGVGLVKWGGGEAGCATSGGPVSLPAFANWPVAMAAFSCLLTLLGGGNVALGQQPTALTFHRIWNVLLEMPRMALHPSMECVWGGCSQKLCEGCGAGRAEAENMVPALPTQQTQRLSLTLCSSV